MGSTVTLTVNRASVAQTLWLVSVTRMMASVIVMNTLRARPAINARWGVIQNILRGTCSLPIFKKYSTVVPLRPMFYFYLGFLKVKHWTFKLPMFLISQLIKVDIPWPESRYRTVSTVLSAMCASARLLHCPRCVTRFQASACVLGSCSIRTMWGVLCVPTITGLSLASKYHSCTIWLAGHQCAY